MANLKDLLDSIHESTELSTASELKSAIELIMDVQTFGSGERDVIIGSFEHGPLFDGDLCSKTSRDRLVSTGYMARGVVDGEEGYNFCTYKGGSAYRLIKAGACA